MSKKGKSSDEEMIFCSFCGRLREEVEKMIGKTLVLERLWIKVRVKRKSKVQKRS